MTEYAGHEVTLEVQLGAVYTAVAQVRDIDGPGITSDQIEVSHRGTNTAADRWRRYLPGMRDGGEVNFDIVFDPDHASHDPTLANSMYQYAEDGTVANYRVTYPGVGTATTTCTFAAYVTNFRTKEPLEDGLTADLTLKVTGPLTWAHVP